MKFPKSNQSKIDKNIHNYLNTFKIMKMIESGFREWNDPEEDIYNDDVKND